MEQLFDYISKRIDLTKEVREFTKSISTIKTLKKGDVLINENQIVNKTYFVLEGCIRSYVFDGVGKEHTLQFALKNDWISDYIAIFNNEKSSQTVECIADSIVVETSVSEGIENIFLRFPKIESIHRKNLERNIVSLQKRILNHLQLTSLDRYKIFLKQYPEIEKYALNYHIASYLGITQQSLSRIRASCK
jgi:CRP-like cAMP-binding protein